MICQVVDCLLHPLRRQPPTSLAPGVGFVEDSPHWPRLDGKVNLLGTWGWFCGGQSPLAEAGW